MGTVLVADDSLTIRTVCQWVVKGTAHEVVIAEAGDEALHLAQQHSPAVIVLDYTLPDQDSYELCRQIKSDGNLSRSAVLMLGGNYAQFDADKAAECGADGSISKPFTTADFLAKLDELTALAESGSVRTLAAAAPAPVAQPAAPAAGPPAAPQAPPPPAEAAQPRARFQFPGRGGAAAPGGPKRFSFPSGGQQQAQPAGQAAPTPAEPTPVPAEPPTPQPSPVVQEQAYHQPAPAPVEPTPAPAAPAPAASAPVAAPGVVDEAIVRAEVQQMVKEMLPAIVKTVLKELITKEVTPHLQRWVETKVEAMMRNR